MRSPSFSIRNIAMALVAGVTLGGCATYYGGGGYGGGGYGGGGYGGLSVGISSGGYYDPYYGGRSYYGWNEGYYYPGTGYYVYDGDRRPHRWSDSQRSYWTQRRAALGITTVRPTDSQPNWSGFTRPRRTTTATRPDREQRIQSRIERRESNATEVRARTERSRPARPAGSSRTAPHQDD